MVFLSQVLQTIGLVFEFLSVLVTINLRGLLSWKRWYNRFIANASKTLEEEFRKDRKALVVLLTLLGIGLIFQIIAIYY